MSSIKWAYAISQWKSRINIFVRTEDHERAFKTLSALGFHAIELRAGTGRWDNLGRPELISLSYGSVASFKARLAEIGISDISGMYWDPSAPAEEEGWEFRLATNPADHDGIVAAAEPFVEMLAELGSDCFVVRPAASAWMTGKLDAEAIVETGTLWNRVGAMTKAHGVKTVLHFDALCALRDEAGIDAVLDVTDPDLVGVALDTAELTIAGIDPVLFYEAHWDRVAHVHLGNTKHVDDHDDYMLPHAEIAMLRGGDGRHIERWYFELGITDGLVDVPAFIASLDSHGYDGWVVVESDHGDNPAELAMINSWYVQKILGVPIR